mgnify:CR=1 FL=1
MLNSNDDNNNNNRRIVLFLNEFGIFHVRKLKKKVWRLIIFCWGTIEREREIEKKLFIFHLTATLTFSISFANFHDTHTTFTCVVPLKVFFFLNYSRRFYYYYYYLHSLITTILVFQHLFSKFLLPGRSLRNISDARIGFR